MKERSLVAFTLLAQAAVGMFWSLNGAVWASGREVPAADLVGPFGAVGVLVAAAAAGSLLHLGTPGNAWRALANLERSWLSREILFLALFGGGCALLVWTLLAGSRQGVGGVDGALACVVAGLGLALVYSMSRVYRLRTVPAWDTALTPASFFLAAGSLGGLAASVALGGSGSAGPMALPLVVSALCLAGELALEPAWRAHRRSANAQVDASLRTDARGTRLRPALLLMALVLSLAASAGLARGPLGAAALVGAAAASLAGRTEFYRSWARRGV